MEEIFKKGVKFVQKNPTILYSLALIVVMTGLILFNAYFSLNKFQNYSDKTLQGKAVLVEDVFRILAGDVLQDKEKMQTKINAIKKEDEELRSIVVMVPAENRDEFEIIAATDEEKIGTKTSEMLPLFAWKNESRGSAIVLSDENGRFLNVTKALSDETGKKNGLLSINLSLNKEDEFLASIITQVYIAAICSVFIVLLLILNHVRLLGYAIKAAKLEEIDKMKDDFISMASHELKSPLTAIRGYAELLGDCLNTQDEEKIKEQKRYLTNIDSLTVRLRDLVEDVLEVSKIEQNRLPMTKENLNLLETINEAVNETAVMAQEKKLVLKNNVTQVSLVNADKKMVKQILVNLLGNGIKYTPKGGVEVSGKEDDDFVFITVADTGLGISAEGLKNLFTKFYRVKTDDTVKISGTGLGLWISRELALKMGGDLSAESIEGVGSHFTLKLKKAK